jgi:hypothetical protein
MSLTLGELILIFTNKKGRLLNEQKTKQQVHDSLRSIIADRDQTSPNYCINDARVGVDMTDQEHVIQCKYVLNNMKYWHGVEARAVRSTLKTIHKRELRRIYHEVNPNILLSSLQTRPMAPNQILCRKISLYFLPENNNKSYH